MAAIPQAISRIFTAPRMPQINMATPVAAIPELGYLHVRTHMVRDKRAGEMRTRHVDQSPIDTSHVWLVSRNSVSDSINGDSQSIAAPVERRLLELMPTLTLNEFSVPMPAFRKL